MRKFTTFAALAASTLLLAGCWGDDTGGSSDPAAETPASGAPTSTAREFAETEEAPAGNQGRTIADVPDDRFMPPGAQGARIFRLADESTECFMNSLGPDSFLTCRTNFANPPTVQDYEGNDVTANAVSWTPDGVIYAHMQFPDTGHVPETLHPYERVGAFGFTCTAYGPATVECSGPQGAATMDAGNVSGAAVPEPKAAPAPAPEQQPAPAGPGLPGIEVPEIPDPLGVLPGQ
ncbi:hypothetical protein [uncultured Corynebacterium sp.]|uniref:hypothetical protein n=1 Tax=uncultured Corynebacterium sp. TaxID=159447 RepID=UPI0025F3D061|nr:hypothetical protein [uncultured Corynebacterium sp.]